MNLTEQQRRAVALPGHAYIEACPGSGKTRVLTAKSIMESLCVEDSPRKVACITFTNAAVDELQSRLASQLNEQQLQSIEVCTIHSFCLSHIFKPFRFRLDSYANRFEIVVADDDRARQLLSEVAQRHGFPAPGQKVFEAFSLVNIDAQGHPVTSGNDLLLRRCMPSYWDECRKRGWIDFSLLLYESLGILSSFKEAPRSLSAKFRAVLVDEFQDTSEIQLSILNHIKAAGESTFFLVGDPHQSIYRFAGASPEAAAEFVHAIAADRSCPLSGNFRSSDEIVAIADRLIPRQPTMEAIGDNAKRGIEAGVFHLPSMPKAIVDHFVPHVSRSGLQLGSCAVLAAWWGDLLPIARACTQAGIAVVGPGARPYKRGRLIVPLLENLAAASTSSMALASTQRALVRALDELGSLGAEEGVQGWAGRLVALMIQQEAQDLLGNAPDAVAWIGAMGASIDQILGKQGIDAQSAFQMSANEVIADLRGRESSGHVDLSRLTVSGLGLFASPERALKLLTVHASKGREFEAVAVVAMNEGRFPHFSAKTESEIEDGRRSAYVALTRAKRLLSVYVDTSDRRNPPSRFVELMCDAG